MFRRRILLAAALAFLPSLAVAQPSPIRAAVKGESRAGTAVPVKDARIPQPPPSHRKDSLWNGLILGAGLGALAGASLGSATVECSECAGFNVPLTFGVLGAGGGAIGAGIDAVRHSHTGVSVQPRRSRLSVSPVLKRDLLALAGSLRF